MTDYDVVVVGAGPAGSAVAKVCAEAGLSVIVYEKLPAPFAVKRCAEGLTGDFEEFVGKIPHKCISQGINGAIMVSPKGTKSYINTESKGLAGYVVDRKVFDPWLNELAVNAGAKVQTNTTVTDVIKEGGFVRGVRVEKDGNVSDVRAKVVVAADGVETTISRKAGLDTLNLPNNIWSAYQVKMTGIKLEDPHKLVFYFGTRIAPKGYIWIFPKGDDSANIGIGISVGQNPVRECLMDFINNTPELKNGKIVETNTGAIPIGGFMKNMVLDGFAVVGDAAHHVNPLHGGGMYEAYAAGRILGRVIADCVRNGDVSAKALDNYNKLWWGKYGKEMKKLEKLSRMAYDFADDDFEALLAALDTTTVDEMMRGSLPLLKLLPVFVRRPRLLLAALSMI